MRKADRLACLGRFSIVVIGAAATEAGDGGRPSDPLPQGAGLGGIAYLAAYGEGQAEIERWDTDASSPRCGLPAMYRVRADGEGGPASSFSVHWTRAIHVAEGRLESDVYGTPRLEPVYNYLLDMLKIAGGSAEMFWLGAYQGLSFDVRDGYSLDDDARAAMAEDIENYVGKLQRFIRTKGVDVKTLASPTADPAGNFQTQLRLISGATGIPERILVGAENGVYAGNTDQDTFYAYIAGRRNSHAEESLLRPLIDRLVEYGYIAPAENEEYAVRWPALFEPTAKERLERAAAMIGAAKAATPYGNTLDVMTVEEVREALGLPGKIPPTEYPQPGGLGDDELLGGLGALPPDGGGILDRTERAGIWA
jgi:hypothetical protein